MEDKVWKATVGGKERVRFVCVGGVGQLSFDSLSKLGRRSENTLRAGGGVPSSVARPADSK